MQFFAENLVIAVMMTASLMIITACLIYGTVRVSTHQMYSLLNELPSGILQ